MVLVDLPDCIPEKEAFSFGEVSEYVIQRGIEVPVCLLRLRVWQIRFQIIVILIIITNHHHHHHLHHHHHPSLFWLIQSAPHLSWEFHLAVIL